MTTTPTRGSWIQTFSNKQFYPLAPKPEDFFIEDIAHALSMKCRFSGHTLQFYSVAQHSVLVSQHCDEQDALWGLLHDASEAYLVDMPSPLKVLPEFAWFRAAEDRVQEAVSESFGLSQVMPPSVHRADKVLLATEKRDMMPARDWDNALPSPLPTKIESWLPAEAERRFLERFAALHLDRYQELFR